ncbi:MAG: DUF3445 domain-containing protein [Pseudomonadota bacterium]
MAKFERRVICQAELPFIPWTDPFLNRLPGLRPIDPVDWLVTDDAFAAQMAYRDALFSDARDTVYKITDAGEAAARELMDLVVETVASREGYRQDGDVVVRPDGVKVSMQSDAPLVVAARLVQEDVLILVDQGAEHQLVGGVLCFPAFWSLAQKVGRSVFDTHQPVDEYDNRMGDKVERVLRTLKVERPVMRANYLVYTNPDLHQPAEEGATRVVEPGRLRYIRVERQTLRRLPRTGAVVFGIHTYVVRASDLDPHAYEALVAIKPELAG